MTKIKDIFQSLKAEKGNKKMLVVILCSVIALLLVAAITVTLVLVLGKDEDLEQSSKTEWPEAGVYYFDAGYDEYTLTLNVRDTFALIFKGESASGTYTLNDGVLTLDFYAEGKENVLATLENDVVTMTYEGASMRLLKKINYVVSFETNSDSGIAPKTVINGKNVTKPADPTRNGYIFVGWYADSEFKSTFTFEQPITANTTIYARWSEDSGSSEYTLKFDLNYDNATNPEAIVTTGGKVFGLPEAERDGYVFCGWWISMEKDSSKLSYRVTEGMMLDANTTVYALWQQKEIGDKLPTPLVNVAAGSISWDAITGARSYSVRIVGPDGEEILSTSTSSTTVNVPFASYSKGEYEITVIANASSGEANNSVCVRYYTNKALRSVSVFNVVGSTLVFNTVENAEKYLITVVCANTAHNHTQFDNGLSRTFSFANCDMTTDGIQFTVTAVADDYAPSTSEVFVYKRTLSAINNIRVDTATEILRWDEVANAEYYMVSVTCGNSAHNHGYINNGAKTYISLKACSMLEGGIVVNVYPVAKGYSSPAAVEYKFDKITLASPQNLVINGTTLVWSAVEGATEYEVNIDGKTYIVTENSYDLSNLLTATYGASFEVRVRALGTTNSLYSDTVKIIAGKMGGLKYSENLLTWDPVIGSDYYELQVNNGDIIRVTDVSTPITFTKAGVNILKVRSVSNNVYSDWAECEVFAHAVTFDTLGGSEIIVRYKAVGDRIELHVPTKKGYTFVDWYNVPGGPVSNGLVYRDEFFTGSGSMVLYAYYAPQKYEIVYNYGAGGSGDRETDQVYYEQDYKLIVPVASSATGSFGGWFSSSGGKGVQYTDSEGNSLAPWSATSGAEVFAFWIDETLAFTQSNVNGRSGYVVSAGARIALVSEVTIPAFYQGLPVLMIAGNAFKDCVNLKVINFPKTVEQISSISPFAGCINLKEVNVYGVDGVNSARYWSRDGVLFDNGTSSESGAKIAYMPLAKSGTYRIPDEVTEIPEIAFMNSALSKIIVPASVTRIGNDAFTNCTNLTSIVFEATTSGQAEKPLAIGKRAFNGCSALESIALPARLTDIALVKYIVTGDEIVINGVDNAFTGCQSLKSVSIASNSKHYKSDDGVIYSHDGSILYYCPESKVGSFTVPNTTHTIAPGAFIGCTELTEVTIPNATTSVGEYAFYGLSLKKVTFLGNGFKDVTVGKYAFRDCTKLSELVITGSRLAVLEEGAFYGCESLTSFTIPMSMVKIGREAFRDCIGLESIAFADNGKELTFGDNAFYNCTSLTSVHLPANVSAIPGIFGGCISLREVTVANDNPYFTSIDGVLFNKAETEIIYFPVGKSGVYTLPSTVTTIANGVFRGISGLDKIVFPSTLAIIGDEAFKGSDIGKIVFEGDAFAESLTIGTAAFQNAKGLSGLLLPASTTVIGDYAFSGSSINLTALPKHLSSIGSYAFSHTAGLNSINIPGSVKIIGDHAFYMCENLREVTLKEGLEIIGDYAFSQVGGGSHFTKITIPASVTTIGNYAFAGGDLVNGATSVGGNLSEITFAAESLLKTIGAHAFEGTKLTTITIPNSVTSIGAYAFNSTGIQEVIFEDSGTEPLVIGTEYVYQKNSAGALVTVVEIGYVFANTSNLTSVIFPSRLSELKENAFTAAGSSSGFTVNFGENSALTTIGASCFAGSNLTQIVIPKSVCNLSPIMNDSFGRTYDRLGIGANAFYGCLSLVSVAFEAGGYEPLTIGENAFKDTGLASIILPARLAPYTCYTGQTIPGLANGSSGLNSVSILASVEVESGGRYYAALGGVLYNGDLTEILFCPLGMSGTVTVPATVTTIASRAFYGCALISEISFAEGYSDMTIGSEAFRGCAGITKMVLPSNVITLGDGAFHSCTSLETLTLPARLQNFNGSVIENCTVLKDILISDGNASIFSDGGVIYSADKKNLLYYPISREDTSYSILPETTVIHSSAFVGNAWLEEVILPAGLREIGAGAFQNCSSLASIHIPASVEVINASAFKNCSNLTVLTFEKQGTAKLTIEESAFESCGITEIEFPARLTAIGNKAFLASSVSRISFEENSALTEIGNSVFQLTKLVSVSLPNGIITIGDQTFNGCSNLVSVVFGEGLLSIGNNTFGVVLDTSEAYPKVDVNASSVVLVSFPASLKIIGSDTFSGCTSLSKVIFAEHSQLEKLPDGTFYESSIEEFVIPASVKEIADKDESDYDIHGVFEKATSLKSVTFEEGSQCAKIGVRAFYGCTSLDTITIPASVSTIGASAFANCTVLKSITIPATTTQLGEALFKECSALENVVLETRATSLPAEMFYGCSSLTSLLIPSGVTNLGNQIFKRSGIERAEIENGEGGLKIIDGVIYDAALTTLLLCLPENAISRVTVPATVTTIISGAFENVNTVREVAFEAGGNASLVIESGAFANCYRLANVLLPERLTVIGEEAFTRCYDLTHITIPSTVTYIGEYAFDQCYKLIEVFNKSKLNIKAKAYNNGYVAYYARNVYTPTSGESIINIDENGYVTATLTIIDRVFNNNTYRYEDITTTYKYLVGYMGDDMDMVLPSDFEAFYDYLFYNNYYITGVVIPMGAGREAMRYDVFTQCSNLSIFLEDLTASSAWESEWNRERPVIFGYDGEEHTYTFVVNGGNAIESVKSKYSIALPVPTHQDETMTFGGWYDNPDFMGAAITDATYYSSTHNILYAKWLSPSDMVAGGTSFEDAITLQLGRTADVIIDEGGKKVYFKFTATETGKYHVTLTGSDRLVIEVWDDPSAEQYSYYDYIGSYTDSSIDQNLNKNWTAGQTYYLVVGFGYSFYTGNLQLTLTYSE